MSVWKKACVGFAAMAFVWTGAAVGQGSLLEELEASFVRLHESVGPCVVNIDVRGAVGEGGGQLQEFFRHFGFPPPEGGQSMPSPRGTGSGFFYDDQGHIVTNYHVIEGAEVVKVRLRSGDEYEAEVVGSDPETDLAVIRIDAVGPLSVASLGDSDALKVGQYAVAIGNARGFEGSVSFGHISALGREGLQALMAQGLTFQNLIQTDAAINLGNSGGPLCNIRGEVIGINTALIWGANSIGFAIPINTVKKTVPELISQGKVTRGYLGVAIDDAKDYADGLGLSDEFGAFVKRVQPDTPAERAGIQTYDVIRKVNSNPVKDATDLVSQVSSLPPGTEVLVEVWRNGETQEFQVDLDERNLAPSQRAEERTVLGMRVTELTPEFRERLTLPEDTDGVLVTRVEPGSPAEEAGLLQGDVILEIAQQSVTNPRDLADLVDAQAEPGKALLLQYRRGENDPDITVLRVPEE